jgi:two-component system, chemotaxis family, chemotaxis protein CheY
MRILIVDDSVPTRRFIHRVVELTGLNFTHFEEAGNGVEALERLAGNDFELILIDINMPVMNGEEFLAAMRAMPGYEQIPVVAISTDATVERIARMRCLGANGYITKPFTPEALRDQLDKVLKRGEGDIVESPAAANGSVADLLRSCARQVLETMFFSTVEDDLEAPARDEGLSGWIGFSGSINGRFAIVLSSDAAMNVTNNFLGVTGESLGRTEQEQVVRELANMICGRFLSRFEPSGHFDLSTGMALPGGRFAEFAAQFGGATPAVQAALQLDVGTATMILSLESGANCQLDLCAA